MEGQIEAAGLQDSIVNYRQASRRYNRSIPIWRDGGTAGGQACTNFPIFMKFAVTFLLSHDLSHTAKRVSFCVAEFSPLRARKRRFPFPNIRHRVKGEK